jgi:hypothetical protein
VSVTVRAADFQLLPIDAVSSVVTGRDVSMRIGFAAARTGSALPAASTEKYRIVCVPGVERTMVDPLADAVVGSEPFVV